jgi:hypothetical protein
MGRQAAAMLLNTCRTFLQLLPQFRELTFKTTDNSLKFKAEEKYGMPFASITKKNNKQGE